MTAPLTGIRVVEVASFVAVPAGGALLADLGADVIKVEVPEGELMRHSRPRMQGFDCDFDGSPQFEMENRGKRSLTLDLARAEAREALVRVIDGADIVLTNLLPARRERFGLDGPSLLAHKPSLIVAGLNGYGPAGAEANAPAFDYTAYWARTGLMDLMREADTVPAWLRPGVGDHAAALALVVGVLAALRVREATGAGQEIDTSLLQTGLYIAGNDLSQSLVARESPPYHDRTRPRNPLWNSYPTRDGRWLFLVMIDSVRYWSKLCCALARPELEDDPRFAGPVERFRNATHLVEIFDAEFTTRPLAEWDDVLGPAGLIWSPVRQMHEALADPQTREMGYFKTVEHPTLGSFETMGPPLRMSGFELAANAPAPALGADSRSVLREAGLSEAEIEAALKRGSG